MILWRCRRRTISVLGLLGLLHREQRSLSLVLGLGLILGPIGLVELLLLLHGHLVSHLSLLLHGRLVSHLDLLLHGHLVSHLGLLLHGHLVSHLGLLLYGH